MSKLLPAGTLAAGAAAGSVGAALAAGVAPAAGVVSAAAASTGGCSAGWSRLQPARLPAMSSDKARLEDASLLFVRLIK